MKLQKFHLLQRSATLLAIILLVSCSAADRHQADTEQSAPAPPSPTPAASQAVSPAQLPVRYRTPGFVVENEQADDSLGDEDKEYAFKVGANIISTRGPQPLWDILKRLARLKGMSVSWASDVDQNVLVDVNISAEDNFFDAIDNLLRQVDYFHEVKGNTIIVKYKATKRFYIAVPYMKGSYTTTVGGNFLTDRDAATGTEGTVKITSDDNVFDIWDNIQNNLDTIIQQWQTQEVNAPTASPESAETEGSQPPPEEEESVEEPTRQATRRMATGGSYYTIDRNVGLITVTAPRDILDRIENYLDTLKTELYRQVIIEAKIIEVYLQDNSKIGLDWSQVLKNFSVTGTVTFGDASQGGQVWPYVTSKDPDVMDPTRFITKVTMSPANFTVMLNALNEQGDAHVLSNPKITVLNGQPALISVGKDITYLKSVSKNVDNSGTSGVSTITYTAEVDSIVEGISLGVVATILDDDSVILHLTPITTDLLRDPIEYETFGNEGLKVGIPKVGVREMSTMVQVNNGEMLIIGGLIDKVEGKKGSFAPVVGDIPIIRYLFGYEEKTLEKRELVILLTPRII